MRKQPDQPFPDAGAALAEVERTILERMRFIAGGKAPADAQKRLEAMQKAAAILKIAKDMTYYEAN